MFYLNIKSHLYLSAINIFSPHFIKGHQKSLQSKKRSKSVKFNNKISWGCLTLQVSGTEQVPAVWCIGIWDNVFIFGIN